MRRSEIEAHYAALQVALVRAGELDAAQELHEWWADNFLEEDPLEELEEELDTDA